MVEPDLGAELAARLAARLALTRRSGALSATSSIMVGGKRTLVTYLEEATRKLRQCDITRLQQIKLGLRSTDHTSGVTTLAINCDSGRTVLVSIEDEVLRTTNTLLEAFAWLHSLEVGGPLGQYFAHNCKLLEDSALLAQSQPKLL